MKVQLEKSFPMPSGPDAVWTFLQDIEAVASCMPGARITERIDAQHYKGTVTVRVGPATMSFRGEVTVSDIDPASRSLRLVGKGTDTTGTSAASMDLQARIEAAGSASELVGTSEVSMSGKAAAFGGRVMETVADQVLKQFAANFAAQVGALSAPTGGPGGSPGAGTADPGATGESSPSPSAMKAPNELDGLALIWAIIKDWLRALLGKSPA